MCHTSGSKLSWPLIWTALYSSTNDLPWFCTDACLKEQRRKESQAVNRDLSACLDLLVLGIQSSFACRLAMTLAAILHEGDWPLPLFPIFKWLVHLLCWPTAPPTPSPSQSVCPCQRTVWAVTTWRRKIQVSGKLLLTYPSSSWKSYPCCPYHYHHHGHYSSFLCHYHLLHQTIFTKLALKIAGSSSTRLQQQEGFIKYRRVCVS